MYKAEARLQVSAQEFYQYLVDQILTDINRKRRNLEQKDERLDGYEYSRKISYSTNKTVDLQIHVGPLVENRYFELSYQTPDAMSRYFYDISQQSDCILVRYVEDGSLVKASDQTVHKITSKLKKRLVEKNIESRLHEIEHSIIMKR